MQDHSRISRRQKIFKYPIKRVRMLLSALGYLIAILILGGVFFLLPIIVTIAVGNIYDSFYTLLVPSWLFAVILFTLLFIIGIYNVYRKYVKLLTSSANKLSYGDSQKTDELLEFVENEAADRGIKPPQLYLSSKPATNAVAVGRRGNGHIVLYDGLLTSLSDLEETKAVLAHEMAHIDLYHCTILTVTNGINAYVQKWLEWTFVKTRRGLNRRAGVSENKSQLQSVARERAKYCLFLINLFQYSISRHREYVADLEAASVVGPEPMIDALRSLNKSENMTSKVSSTHAAVCIYWPSSNGFLNRLVRTHPPFEKRIRNIKNNT